MPWSASGRMGTPASIARRNAPSLNGRRSLVGERVPSGKIITDTFRARISRHFVMASTALGPEASLHRHIAGDVHEPSHDRNAEQLGLGEPLHLPGEVADQQDVGERLVVGDDDVGLPRVGRHRAAVAELPIRVQRCGDHPDLAEEIAGPVPAGICAVSPAAPAASAAARAVCRRPARARSTARRAIPRSAPCSKAIERGLVCWRTDRRRRAG